MHNQPRVLVASEVSPG